MSDSVDVGSVVADRYALRERLSEAPAYTSYRAFDQDAEVDVDFWWMRQALFPDQARRDRFIGASVELRGLSHPHLRKVFDAGIATGGGLYVTTQLGTHDGLLPEPGRGRLGPTDLLHYVTSIAGALEAAHDIGYVHGRLVPSDIVHVSGLIKLGGVGLWADAEATSARECWGKYERYIAPEVFAGRSATPAADVYSLARLCGELAAGSLGKNIAAELMGTDPELAEVLTPALAVLPHQRPQSAGELLDALRTALVDDRVPTGETHAAPPRIRLPSGAVDSGTPIDAGGYAEEDDPTRHIGRAPSVDDFPDDPLVPPPGLRPGRALGKSLSSARAGFEDDVETVAESGMPAFAPPPAVPRRRKTSQTRPDGSGQSQPRMARPALPGAPPVRPQTPAPLPEPPGAHHRARGKVSKPRQVVKTKLDGSPPQLPSSAPEPSGPPLVAPPTPPPGISPGLKERRKRRVGTESGPIRFVSMKDQDDAADQTVPGVSAATRERRKRRVGTESGPVRFVSMKEQDDAAPKTPRVPIVDRPEMQPKLRSIASSSPDPVPQTPLGNYAPARARTAEPVASASGGIPKWVWAFVGVAVVAVSVTLVVVLTRGGSSKGAATPPDAAVLKPPPPKPVAVVTSKIDAGVEGPCPANMVLVAAHQVCIDSYESPGKGRMPEVGLTAAQAAAKCRSRGARLCTSVEWESACRGKFGASWPYGSAYSPRACNANRNRVADVVTTGSFPECVSAAGAYDMSGNVAEWVAGGNVRGGSAVNRSDGRCSSRQRRRKGARGYSDVGFRCCTASRDQ